MSTAPCRVEKVVWQDDNTDNRLRKGIKVPLESAFRGVKNSMTASLASDLTDHVSYGCAKRPVVRVYPQDGEVWWVMREQVKQLRAANGLELFESATPEQVSSLASIQKLRRDPIEMNITAGMEPAGEPIRCEEARKEAFKRVLKDQ